MSDKRLKLTCPNCKRTWYIDLDRLDEQSEQILYRDSASEPTESRRAQCQKCKTYVVFTVPGDQEVKHAQ